MYDSNPTPEIGAIVWLTILGIYLYFSYATYKIAQKLGHESPWWAWVPILNTVQIIQMACKPMIWLLFLFVPIVNVVCIAILWWEVAKRTGNSGWVGIGTLVPMINFVTIGVMAWGTGTPQTPTPPTQEQPKQPTPVG